MWGQPVVMKEITDPAVIEEHRERGDQFARNSAWLAEHWLDLLPQARGRFIAVAGQEAYIADTPEDAWAWTSRAHPDDKGPVVQYVFPSEGPRSYAYRWALAEMR
jgi:hypothetical protein